MLGYGPIFSSNGAHMRGEAMDPNSDVGRIADLIEVSQNFASRSDSGPYCHMRKLERMSPFACLNGIVEHGFGRGSVTLGFPTANLNSVSSKSVAQFLESPECQDGIYIGWVRLPDDSNPYMAAISVGLHPTFDDSKIRLLEAHLLDYTGPDFYDVEVRIVLCAFIRESLKFTSMEDLKTEIWNDCQFGREWLSKDNEMSSARVHTFLHDADN